MGNHKTKINLFCCSTSFDPRELEEAETNGAVIKVIPVPCSGKIDVLYLTKAFETGADGVAVITCRKDECRYLEGNLRAGKRVEAVDSLLAEAGLGKGRMVLIQSGEGGLQQVRKEVDEFCRRIEASPLKEYAGDELELDKE